MFECFKNPNVIILILCQCLGVSTAIIMVASGGIIGLELSGGARWSTLPITFYVFGIFLMLFPASLLCGKLGRKPAFLLGAMIGILGGLVFYFGITARILPLVCVGTFLIGVQRSFIEYYRFCCGRISIE